MWEKRSLIIYCLHLLAILLELTGGVYGEEGTCPPDLFHCQVMMAPGKWCISRKWVCDGEKDCVDGSDELHNCKAPTCQPGKFQCEDGHFCIPMGWKCDDDNDCIDGSDERPEICQEPDVQCQPNWHKCNSSHLCIPYAQLCDNYSNCHDGSDEGPQCNSSVCSSNPCPDGSTCKPLSGRSFTCICSDGYAYNSSGSECTNVDECKYDGYCDQKCTDSLGSYNCSCGDNYRQDGTHCIAINEPDDLPPYILFADRQEIRKVHINGSDLDPPVVFKVDRTKAMGYNFDNKSVCYVISSFNLEQDRDQLDCSSLVGGSNWSIPMARSLNNVNGMVWDWVNENWYFTDEKHDLIFVCSANGTYCITVINTNLKGPMSIAVDPMKGFIFFTGFGYQPKISRALLNGEDHVELQNSKQVVQPLGLTLDLANEHLYWADAYLDRLERVNYDGTGRKLIIKRQWVKNIFGLAILNNMIFATSQRTHSLVRVDRLDYLTRPPDSLRTLSVPPTVVKVVHRMVQPKPKVNPCKVKGCQQLCINMPQKTGELKATCLCQAGERPHQQDDSKCISAFESQFLLYSSAKAGEVKGISLNSSNHYEVMPPISGLGHPVAIDFHSADQYIYYSDVSKYSIGRRKIDGTGRDDAFIATGIKKCEGIAIDFMGRNIYWTDEGQNAISVARLDSPSISRTLISEGISHPRAIVVDPRQGQGWMYWTDWVQHPSPRNSRIERAFMNGQNRTVLIDTQIHWVNGLSLDYTNMILYWCDAFYDRIEYLELNCAPQGNKTCRKALMSSHPKIDHPYGVVHAFHGDVIYWTEFSKGSVMRFSRSDKENASLLVKTLRQDSPPIYEIRIYDNTTQLSMGDNACSKDNGGCDHLCLATPTGRSCMCLQSYLLSDDGKSCQVNQNYTAPPNCSSNMFMCKNGHCISKHWLCDGDNDCGDNSDEDNSTAADGSGPHGPCFNVSCLEPDIMYMCSNNRCIYRQWMCDGEYDCPNKEDEIQENCNKSECAQNMTRCPKSHRCIPNSWRCDHDKDCDDGSDEKNCTYEACRLDQFMCTNKRCVPLEYHCDGDNDCHDNSDEENCTSCNNGTHFKCRNDDTCLNLIFKCDGQVNCPGGSDEENCKKRGYEKKCEESQFHCDNNLCIHHHVVCDGDNDCGDRSDERNCTTHRTCGPNDYKCPGEMKCITSRWLCDKEMDCIDGSDEENCTAEVTCIYPERLCNASRQCVTVDQLCDGQYDCEDRSDEGGLCELEECLGANDCSHTCVNTPEGHHCTCPHLKHLATDNHTCVDLYPCRTWGRCSQLCREDGTSYECYCLPKYTLEEDRFTCKPTVSAQTYLIFSNRHEIRRLDVHHASYVTLVSGLRNTIALDYFYNKEKDNGEGSLVFWTDVVDDKLYRGTMISNSVTDIQAIVNIGLATTEGLAVDWVAKHIYWVESNLDQIEVANFDGSQRATLVAGHMASPRAIVVDPRKGMLFWSDWDSSQPRIEMCSMAGEGRKVIFNVSSIKGAGWPNGLTADYEMERLYWIDARSDSIHTVTYNGSDHHEILRSGQFLSHPFAIDVFGNYVFWTDWRTNSLVRANKWNGTDQEVIQRTVTQPFDLHVFHPQRQPDPEVNPCNINSGGCGKNALCLLTFNGQVKCRCPHLTKLTNDGTDCTLDGNFLLFAKKQEIRGVHLDNANFNIIPALTVPFVHSPLGMDYDVETRRLFWIQEAETSLVSGISSANLNGTNVEVIVNSGLSQPSGLAIDWISRNMYFSSHGPGPATISVARLSGVYRMVLLEDGRNGLKMTKPTSIAVHPTGRPRLYWSDLGDETDMGSVWESYLDGSNPIKLFPREGVSVNVFRPKSLSIDHFAKELWWVNSEGTGTFIVRSDLDGNNVKAFVPSNPALLSAAPSSITVHKDKLFWASSSPANKASAGIIAVMSKINGTDFKILRQNTVLVTSLKVFVTERLPKDELMNGCKLNNSGCSQLCMPLDRNTSVCRCTVGYRLDADGHTCKGIREFIMYSNRTQILGISLNPNEGETKALAPISKIVKVSAIDFDSRNDYIYWVDNQAHAISRIKRDLTHRETIIGSGIFNVDGIAVDWIAGNIYWTDYMKGVIEVSRVNGSNRFVVVAGNMGKPRAIIVDPVRGYMYWTDWGQSPRIERARLDGSEREVFINSSIQKPYGLAIDHDTNELYWCDQSLDKIVRVNVTTRSSQVIIRNVTDAMSLAVHGNYIYWIDVTVRNGSLMRALKNGTNITAVRENIGGNINNVKVFDTQNGDNKCSRENAGCSELCFYLGNNQVRCQCAHGHVVNKTQCADYDSFLAFSKVSGIETLHMFDELNPNAPRPTISLEDRMRNVIGLAADYPGQRYFFTDIQRGDIQSVKFDGTDAKVIAKKVGSAEGLAYDSTRKFLYWTSYTNSSISRIHVDDAGALRTKLVQLTDKDHPRAIVLDVCNSKMYWTNWNDAAPSIQRADIFGHNNESIITTKIRTPNGLAIDHRAAMLYWSDARLDKLERCDLDGRNRVEVVSEMSLGLVPKHPFGLAVYGDFIYWTDWIHRGVLRVNKYTGVDFHWLKKNIPRQPMGIVAVAADTDDCMTNKCQIGRGGCEQFCKTSERGDVICSCKDNFTLQRDNKTCSLSCDEDEFSCEDSGCIKYDLICDGREHCADGSDESNHTCETRKCPKSYFSCNSTGQCIPQKKVCDRVQDCRDKSDESSCKCGDDEFTCITSGSCIKSRYRCDHDKDCPDASDEMDCTVTDCSYYQRDGSDASKLIKCNYTTSCILEDWKCDGHNDCWDYSDEKDCNGTNAPTPCADDWYHCSTSGECVPNNWLCDGEGDCNDKTDEQNCTTECTNKEFLCDMRCIPRYLRCDGSNDCDDRTDEKDCKEEPQTCHSNEFYCNATGNCIPRKWLCDGDDDCTDGDDERPQNGCEPVECSEKEMVCSNWNCVLKSFYCDHDDDCGDGSDEPETCVYATCGPDQFQCHRTKQCIDMSKTCNGYFDCSDHSDESKDQCTPSACGNSALWLCDNKVCINETLVCNGHDDCGDFSDEISCSINECEQTPKVCNSTCEDLKVGYRCTCPKGFALGNNSHSYCKDIDECHTFPLPCSHYCINTHGSFRCTCAEGYQLGQDKMSCKVVATAEVPEPVLLISNRYYIRNVTLSGSHKELLSMNLTNAVALDFDWKERKIYWSDVTASASRIMRMSDNGTNREILHNTTLRNPDGIAVDWLGRNLYWCDKTTDTIEVSKLDGRYHHVLVKKGIQEPRAIAVHPYMGWLFYSDWGDAAHIGRLGMDGSRRSNIITEHLGWPNALTIDYVTSHIIWADARLDYIAMAGLDGSNRHYIIQDNLPHIFAIVVFEDHLYWTDWEYKSLEAAHKFTGQGRRNITHMIHRPMDVQVYHPYRQRAFKKSQQNPCENDGGCGKGTLCLIKPGGTQQICACPEHHVHPKNDKTTCIANCTSSEFLCKNTYKCIPFWWKCDGQDDCGDGYDEREDCPPYYCRQPGLFQCQGATSHYHCISPTQICDGIAQCENGTDELNCANYTCLDTQFKCESSPKCIALSKKCNMAYDCEDHSDERDCPTHTCAPHQFQCDNKRCIPYVWRCDNDNDCGDNSDEPANCRESTCREDFLKCNSSGRCVPLSWKCDGDSDCGSNDLSDEPHNECSSVTCDPTYFKCDNNRCIPGRWRCDYDDDCHDGSDEHGCQARNCSESEFRCSNKRCILLAFHCDGIYQCNDTSDEENCTKKQCDRETQFTCATSGYCIPKNWRCDGELDCGDSSDEFGCSRKCTWNEFRCADSICIPQQWQCDGQADCIDGTDESQDVCRNHICLPGFYKCGNNKCIPYSHVCDGISHCSDDADEKNCGLKVCKANEFRCQETGQCIRMDHVCDSYRDCADGSDEKGICYKWVMCRQNSDCPSPNMECHLQNKTGHCICGDGFKLHYNTDTKRLECKDIDECAQFGTCSQICRNAPGSHRHMCVCDEGFFPVRLSNSSQVSCKASVHLPYLLIGVENEIHTSDVDPRGQYRREFPPPRDNATTELRISSMAVSIAQGVVYIGNQGISRSSILKYSIPDHLKIKSLEPIKKRSKRDASYDHSKSDDTANNRADSTDTNSPASGAIPRMEVVQVDGVVEPVGLAWDWVSQRLYWIDQATSKIQVLDTRSSEVVTLVETNLDMPTAIVVDPESRQMFWAERGLNPRIVRAWLDGSHQETIVKEEIAWPAGLAIDYPNRRLYWTDTKHKVIESVLIEGRNLNRVKVYVHPPHDETPYRIDVFEDRLYVTSYYTHQIHSYPKFNWAEQKSQLLVRGLTRIGDITVVHKAKQKESLINDTRYNPCGAVANPCGQMALCMNTPNDHMYQCVCPNKTVVNPTESCAKPKHTKGQKCDNFCFHNGTCIYTEAGDTKCKCRLGFTGSRCEQDQCKDRCLNNGECKPSESGPPRCACTFKYSGERCNHYKCTNHCKNQGFCQVDKISGDPTCICHTKYMGEVCETVKPFGCYNYTCNKQGSCEPHDDRPVCHCQIDYTGDHCEKCQSKCSRNGACPPVTCPNGHCQLTNGSPRCVCNWGYIEKCSDGEGPNASCVTPTCVNKCDGHCLHDATCRIDSRTGEPSCQCLKGYGGLRCEQNMCQNRCLHGDCKILNGAASRCLCKPGWQGNTCNISIPCLNNPCKNGAICRTDPKNSSQWQCQCPLGFSNLDCSEEKACEIVRCQNGGVCTKDGNSYICKCPRGFVGQTCKEILSGQCLTHCLNEGQCTECDKSGTTAACMKCKCHPDYSGQRCEKYIRGNTGTNTVVAIAIPAILCILIVFVILGICIYRRRANRQFKHMRMSETGNVEISNPIYMRDYDDDEGGDIGDAFTLDPDKPTNFSNPMYDTLYNETAASLVSPEGEKNQLLKDENVKVRFYRDEERQPLDQSHA